ncbi:unnamed protein product [Boreogadus saida]
MVFLMVFLMVLYLNRGGIKRWLNNIREGCRDQMEVYHYRYEQDSDPRLANDTVPSDVTGHRALRPQQDTVPSDVTGHRALRPQQDTVPSDRNRTPCPQTVTGHRALRP